MRTCGCAGSSATTTVTRPTSGGASSPASRGAGSTRALPGAPRRGGRDPCTTDAAVDGGRSSPTSGSRAGFLAQRGARPGQGRREGCGGIDVYSGMSRCASIPGANYGRTNGVVVPGGVDVEAFTGRGRGSRTRRSCFPARSRPRKGVAVLLEALPLIAASEPDVELWLSGPGDARPIVDAAPPEARERTHLLGLGDGRPARTLRARLGDVPSVDLGLVRDGAARVARLRHADGATTTLRPRTSSTRGSPGSCASLRTPRGWRAPASARSSWRGARDAGDLSVSAERFDWDRDSRPCASACTSGATASRCAGRRKSRLSRVVVTGAAGYVGGRLVRTMLDEGREVHGSRASRRHGSG